MSEVLPVKKRGRPRKVVAENPPVSEATTPKENGTVPSPKSRAKAQPAEDEATVKRKTRTRASKASTTQDASLQPENSSAASAASSTPKTSKTTTRKTRAKKGDVDAAAKSLEETHVGCDDTRASSKAKKVAASEQQDNLQNLLNLSSTDASSGQLNLESTSKPKAIVSKVQKLPLSADPTLSLEAESSTALEQGATPSSSDHNNIEKPDQASSLEQPASSTIEKSSLKFPDHLPDPPAPSRIIDALIEQYQQPAVTESVQSPPTHILPAAGPNFSASVPLNSPSMAGTPSPKPQVGQQPFRFPQSPSNLSQIQLTAQQANNLRGVSRTQQQSVSSLPKSKVPRRGYPPLDLPTGPPNPGQLPLTPQQIEDIRSSPAYKSAYNKWTRLIVAAPIAIVTSYFLYDRYQKTINSKSSPGSGSSSSPSSQIPPSTDLDSNSARRTGGAKPRIIADYVHEPSSIIMDIGGRTLDVPMQREKRLLEL